MTGPFSHAPTLLAGGGGAGCGGGGGTPTAIHYFSNRSTNIGIESISPNEAEQGNALLSPSVAVPLASVSDSNDNLYTVWADEKVRAYDSAMNLLWTSAAFTNQISANLDQVAVGPDNSIYLADGNTLKQIDPDTGNFTAFTYTAPSIIRTVAVNLDGDIWLTGGTSPPPTFVHRINADGTVVWTKGPYGELTANSALDANDNLYVATSTTVYKLDGNGDELWSVSSASSGVFDCLTNGSHLFVARANAILYKYDPADGSVLDTFTYTDAESGNRHLGASSDLSPDGFIYNATSNDGSNWGYIIKIRTSDMTLEWELKPAETTADNIRGNEPVAVAGGKYPVFWC